MTTMSGSNVQGRRFQQARWVIVAAMFVLFIVPGAAYSDQDSGTAPAAQESSSRGTPQDSTPYLPTVKNVDTGQSLSAPLSSLRWGRLSLLSFETSYLFDNNYALSKDNPRSAQAGTLRGHLVYSLRRRRSELTVQYRPYLLASDGQIQGDYATHNVDFHSAVRLTSRWLLSLFENFQLAPDRGRIQEFGLIPNNLTGDLTKNPYLATGRKYMENDAGAALQRMLSARNSVQFDFRYQLIRVSGELQNGSGVTPDPSFLSLQSVQAFGAGMGWSHSFSASQDIQVRYGYERRFYNSGGDTQLHNLLLSYNRRIRRSLFMHVSAGPAVLIPFRPSCAVTSPPWTKSYQGSFALTKSFQASSITLSAARNQDFTGVIGDTFNDRFDFSYTRRLSPHWNMVAGTGYVRQGFSSGPGVRGQQIWFRTDYRLSRAWSVYTSIVSLQETGGLQLGRRNLVMAGIRWAWRPALGDDSGY